MTPSSKSTTKPIKKVVEVFSKLQVRYGHKWTSNFSTPELVRLAVSEWADGLSGFTAEEIGRGLEVWQEDWPPSLPEFKRACGRNKPQAHKEFAVSPPLTDEEHNQVMRQLEELKRGMG